MNEQYINAFLSKDIVKAIQKKNILKCFQKFGISTYGDIIAIDNTDLEAKLCKLGSSVETCVEALRIKTKIDNEYEKIQLETSEQNDSDSDNDGFDDSTIFEPVFEQLQFDVNIQQNNELSFFENEPDDGAKAEDDISDISTNLNMLSGQDIKNKIKHDIKRESKKFINAPNISPKQESEMNEEKIDHIPDVSEAEFDKITVGRVRIRDKFENVAIGDELYISHDEEGLKRHVLICGSTGSGKTVAARNIIEQAALLGIPSIVIDPQGDLSSLIFQLGDLNRANIFDHVQEIICPETKQEEDNLLEKIISHVEAFDNVEPVDLRDFSKKCITRIFTPAFPELGLSMSIPPYIDVLSAVSNDKLDDPIISQELKLLVNEEASYIVKQLRLPANQHHHYEELITEAIWYAHRKSICIEGEEGIKEFIKIVKNIDHICKERCGDVGNNVIKKLKTEIATLTYKSNIMWIEGTPLNINNLIEKHNGETPINIINISTINKSEDKKRVLRYLIVSIYKYAINNPSTGLPSLLFYIDEVGRGYGERSIASPEADTSYKVYSVLSQLVAQARKYGVSVVLASQRIIDFHPSIRSQLLTKIYGKSSPQDHREIEGDISSIGREYYSSSDIQEFVKRELPGLSQPHLMFQNTYGKACIYKQRKCLTFDYPLKKIAIHRWKKRIQEEANQKYAECVRKYKNGEYREAIECLKNIFNDPYLGSKDNQIDILRGKCHLKLDELDEAAQIYQCFEGKNEQSEYWISFISKFAVSILRLNMIDKYLIQLNDISIIIKDKYPSLHEKIQLAICKDKIVRQKSPEEATNNLTQIENTKSRKVSIFTKLWKHIIKKITNWKGINNFIIEAADKNGSIIEGGGERGTIIVQKLVVDENCSEESLEYTSELIENSDAFTLSSNARNREIKDIKSREELEQRIVKLLKARAYQNQNKMELAIDNYSDLLQPISLEELDLSAEIKDQLRQEDAEIKEKLWQLDLDNDPIIRCHFIEKWIDKLHWRKFEFEVANLFTCMGYDTWVTKPTGDGGVDVRARKNHITCVIQCKHKTHNVGVEDVMKLHATQINEEACEAILVTTSYFTKGAKEWAEKHHIRLIDKKEMVRLFNQNVYPSKRDNNSTTIQGKKSAKQSAKEIITNVISSESEIIEGKILSEFGKESEQYENVKKMSDNEFKRVHGPIIRKKEERNNNLDELKKSKAVIQGKKEVSQQTLDFVSEARKECIVNRDEVNKENIGILVRYRSWKEKKLNDPREDNEKAIQRNLIDIIKAEGPILADRAYSLYTHAAGIRRGRIIDEGFDEALNNAIYEKKILKRDEWREGETRYLIVRAQGTEKVIAREIGPRKIEQIPPAEIATIFRHILRENPRLRQKGLFKELRDIYGIGRLTQPSILHLEKIWSLYEKKIKGSGGVL